MLFLGHIILIIINFSYFCCFNIYYFYGCSPEDNNINNIVDAWLKHQSNETQVLMSDYKHILFKGNINIIFINKVVLLILNKFYMLLNAL